MSKIRYIVAMTLDGYVAGPNGEADWILMDPDVNFAELWAQFDTLLMGRKTYDAAKSRLGESFMQGMKTVVVSRMLRSADHPNLTVLSNLNRDHLQSLRSQSTKDIWLMGGGELFRSMLALHEVDTVEVPQWSPPALSGPDAIRSCRTVNAPSAHGGASGCSLQAIPSPSALRPQCRFHPTSGDQSRLVEGS
jgi:dihydrofolate reductase